MTLSVPLSPEAEERLRKRAAAVGQTLDSYAASILEQAATAPLGRSGQEATIALLRAWNEEDATVDPAEIANRQREWEEFAASINSHHSSHRKVYP